MKPRKVNPTKIRRTFAETFKREALRNWLSSGKSAEVVAGELGLTASRRYAWKPLSCDELHVLLAAARREQRDILF